MAKGRFFRKSVGSQRALSQRRKALALGAALAIGIAGALALLLMGCGGGNPGAVVPPSLSLGGGFGPDIITGKKDVMDSDPSSANPGGVPIFYQNVVLGGIGVVTSSDGVRLPYFKFPRNPTD